MSRPSNTKKVNIQQRTKSWEKGDAHIDSTYQVSNNAMAKKENGWGCTKSSGATKAPWQECVLCLGSRLQLKKAEKDPRIPTEFPKPPRGGGTRPYRAAQAPDIRNFSFYKIRIRLQSCDRAEKHWRIRLQFKKSEGRPTDTIGAGHTHEYLTSEIAVGVAPSTRCVRHERLY